MKRITIIGSGATAQVTAVYLLRKGYSVIMCDEENKKDRFDEIHNAGGISIIGYLGEETILPDIMVTDFKIALQNAECIIICSSAARHQRLAEKCAPYVQNGQAYIISTGNMGSVLWRREIEKYNKSNDFLLGEISDNLWVCRKKEGRVEVALPYSTKKIAANPSENTRALIQAFDGIFEFSEGNSIIETTLNCPNLISHVAGAMMNISLIENKREKFAFFKDGLSPSVIKMIAVVEEERNKVLEKLGLESYKSVLPLLTQIYNQDNLPGMDKFISVEGPSDLSHRYVSEDASCGMSILVTLGEMIGVNTKLSKSFLVIAGMINNADYLREGRGGLCRSEFGQIQEHLSLAE